jgi:hypothetical protein
MHPQVPDEQRSQRLWCVQCFRVERIDVDEVAEELGWHEGRCPDCAESVPTLCPEEAATP